MSAGPEWCSLYCFTVEFVKLLTPFHPGSTCRPSVPASTSRARLLQPGRLQSISGPGPRAISPTDPSGLLQYRGTISPSPTPDGMLWRGFGGASSPTGLACPTPESQGEEDGLHTHRPEWGHKKNPPTSQGPRSSAPGPAAGSPGSRALWWSSAAVWLPRPGPGKSTDVRATALRRPAACGT